MNPPPKIMFFLNYCVFSFCKWHCAHICIASWRPYLVVVGHFRCYPIMVWCKKSILLHFHVGIQSLHVGFSIHSTSVTVFDNIHLKRRLWTQLISTHEVQSKIIFFTIPYIFLHLLYPCIIPSFHFVVGFNWLDN